MRQWLFMLRPLTLAFVLLFAAGTAFAQMSVADLKDDSARMDARWLSGYKRTMETRDVFASIHDSIHHSAYTDLQGAHAHYVAIKAELEKSITAGDTSKGTRQMGELEDAGKEVSEKLAVYTNSSEDGVQKIQIGLGVLAFLICGAGYLLFKRRK